MTDYVGSEKYNDILDYLRKQIAKYKARRYSNIFDFYLVWPIRIGLFLMFVFFSSCAAWIFYGFLAFEIIKIIKNIWVKQATKAFESVFMVALLIALIFGIHLFSQFAWFHWFHVSIKSFILLVGILFPFIDKLVEIKHDKLHNPREVGWGKAISIIHLLSLLLILGTVLTSILLHPFVLTCMVAKILLASSVGLYAIAGILFGYKNRKHVFRDFGEWVMRRFEDTGNFFKWMLNCFFCCCCKLKIISKTNQVRITRPRKDEAVPLLSAAGSVNGDMPPGSSTANLLTCFYGIRSNYSIEPLMGELKQVVDQERDRISTVDYPPPEVLSELVNHDFGASRDRYQQDAIIFALHKLSSTSGGKSILKESCSIDLDQAHNRGLDIRHASRNLVS